MRRCWSEGTAAEDSEDGGRVGESTCSRRCNLRGYDRPRGTT